MRVLRGLSTIVIALCVVCSIHGTLAGQELPAAPGGAGGLPIGKLAEGLKMLGAQRPAQEEVAEPDAIESEDTETAGSGVLSGGLRGILKMLSPAGSKVQAQAGEEEAGAADESQKRIMDLMRMASLNIGKARVADAMRNINDLISLKPYDSDFHFALGLCYRKLGKYKDALKKLQDVLDLGGPKALVSLLKAEAYAVEDDKENAFKLLKEAAIGGRNIINDVSMLPHLRKYKEDTEFIKLALQLEKFEVSVSRKHDPFTNPFPLANPEATGAGQEATGEPQAVNLTPEEQDRLLKEAKKAYARVLFYVKLEDEAKAMKAYNKLRELLGQKDLVTVPKISNDFRFLANQMEEVEVQIEGIRLKFYYNQAQGKLKNMRDNFLDSEYKRVEAIHAEIVELTDEMSRTNEQYKPVAERILASSVQWLTRAKVRQEFETRKPKIQGIVIAADGKMAVVNDRVVKQGEAIEDFRIVKVESNKVTFRYKGEEIPLVFRRY